MYNYIDQKHKAVIRSQKIDLPATHPMVNLPNHTRLMDYLTVRLGQGKQVRDNSIPRYVAIDRAVSGWMQLSEEDRKRKVKEHTTGQPQATLMNLPISFVQLDDMMTYFAETFSPGRGMFYQAGNPKDVESSKQIVTLMNNHAIYAAYYRELSLFLWACLKYNLGGMATDWDSEVGPKLSTDAQGNMVNESGVVWSGNRVRGLDMYNTLMDPTVAPDMIYSKGEWAATVDLVSHYWVAQQTEDGKFANVEGAVNETSAGAKYYRHPPTEVKLQNGPLSGGQDGAEINWVNELADTPSHMTGNMHELVKICIRLRATEFGLSPRVKGETPKHELWEFTILNGTSIVAAKRRINVHNHIPFYFGTVNNDGLGKSQKSVGEMFDPLQRFASHLMNIHIKATRKRLGGLTIYDSSIVDLSKIPDDEVNARVPLKSSGIGGKAIKDSIWQDRGDVDTTNTMADIEGVLGLLNVFFPTQASPSAIANIDRAVSNQVTAVQQGSNRRLHKAAALLDVCALTPMRFSLYYNILQFQNDNETVSDYRGSEVKIDLASLRETDLPFIVGMGLKAIDRMMIADKLQQVIFALIQNPQAAAQVDVLGMIDYWSSMLDIDIDFKTFKIEPPAAGAVGPDGQPIQPAGGTGVVPATNPAAITEPIYG